MALPNFSLRGRVGGCNQNDGEQSRPTAWAGADRVRYGLCIAEMSEYADCTMSDICNTRCSNISFIKIMLTVSGNTTSFMIQRTLNIVDDRFKNCCTLCNCAGGQL